MKDLKKIIKETEENIKTIKEENAKLKDELDSLWSMMDELKESDIKNWAHVVKHLQEQYISESLISTKKADC